MNTVAAAMGVFDVSNFIIWGLVVVLSVIAWRRGEGRLKNGLRRGVEMFLVNGPRIIVALLAAGFISFLLPKALVAQWLGSGSGWQGIALGCLVGPLIPGGPLVIFPLFVALLKAGAGLPAVFACLTSASVWGIHRILMFEVPMMGTRFVANRIFATLAIPPFAGGMTVLLIRLLGEPAGFGH